MIKILPIKKGKITLKPIEEESNITINQATTVINENYTEEEVNEIVADVMQRYYYDLVSRNISGEYYIEPHTTVLGAGSFCYFPNVTKFVIPNSVTSMVGDGHFRWCHGIQTMVFPENEFVTKIPNYCFTACQRMISTSGWTIPSNITSIGNYAFQACIALTNATFPSSITTIGNYVFQNNSAMTTFVGEGVTTLGTYVFDNCTKLANVTLPNVTSIGDSCFYRTSVLRNLSLPNLRTLAQYAFRSCGIYQFIFPNTVTNLNLTGVFYEAKSLKLVDIPSGVTALGGNFFYNCTALQTVIVRRPTPPSLNASAFRGVKENGKIYVPYGCSAAYLASAAWATSTGNYYPKKYGWTIHELDEDGNIPTE